MFKGIFNQSHFIWKYNVYIYIYYHFSLALVQGFPATARLTAVQNKAADFQAACKHYALSTKKGSPMPSHCGFGRRVGDPTQLEIWTVTLTPVMVCITFPSLWFKASRRQQDWLLSKTKLLISKQLVNTMLSALKKEVQCPAIVAFRSLNPWFPNH